MSNTHETWAWNRAVERDLKPAPTLVLIALADSANHETGVCDWTAAKLAERARVSRATLFRYLAELESEGLIRRAQVRPKGSRGIAKLAFWVDPGKGDWPICDLINGFDLIEDRDPSQSETGLTSETAPVSTVRRHIETPTKTPTTHTQKASPSSHVDARAKSPPPIYRRCEDDPLTTEFVEIALDKGLTEVEAHGVWEEFCVYWQDRRDARAKKSERGWKTCWRSWCERQVERRPSRPPPRRNGAPPTLAFDASTGELINGHASEHHDDPRAAVLAALGPEPMGERTRAMLRVAARGEPEDVRRRREEQRARLGLAPKSA